MRGDGYCPLPQVLQHKSVARLNTTLGDVLHAVTGNAKKRFAIKMEEDGKLNELDDAQLTPQAMAGVDTKKLWIAAVQGHSTAVPELELKAVNSLADLPEKSVVVHGTKQEFWAPIKATVSTSDVLE
jgi:RNA:NAD 2'-phosphotransferase (TPT1/KptA family)